MVPAFSQKIQFIKITIKMHKNGKGLKKLAKFLKAMKNIKKQQIYSFLLFLQAS
jgi:hypothetical protein